MYANRSVIDCQGTSDNNDADNDAADDDNDDEANDNDGNMDLKLLMVNEMTMMRTTYMIACVCVCACMCVCDCVFVSLCLSSVRVVALLLLTVEMSPLCAFALVVQISCVCLSPRKLHNPNPLSVHTLVNRGDEH